MPHIRQRARALGRQKADCVLAAVEVDFRSESAEGRDEAKGVHRGWGAAAAAAGGGRHHPGSDTRSQTDLQRDFPRQVSPVQGVSQDWDHFYSELSAARLFRVGAAWFKYANKQAVLVVTQLSVEYKSGGKLKTTERSSSGDVVAGVLKIRKISYSLQERL